jgi:predicted nucleotidyltransferase
MKPYETSNIQTALQRIKVAILSVVPDTLTIYLFGSYVHGTPHKDSDFDIFVVIPDSNVNPLDTEVKITANLYSNGFRKPVDLIVKHNTKFNQRKNLATLDKVVATKGVKIYG